MDQVNPEGVVAPVETVETPTAPPDGQQVEAVKPANPPEPEDHEVKGVAKRIKELTEARRNAEAREARLLALLEQQRQAPAPRQEPEQDEPPLKTLKDFGYDEGAFLKYTEARAEARAEKAVKAAADRYRAEQEAISRRAKFDERVEAFAKSVEDYHEVVTDSTPVSEAMADFLLDSDQAGALMYYLGNNPEEARKLYYLSPAKAGRELQRLEDRLTAERKKAAEKPVSQAPPPAPKIEGAGGGMQKAKPDDPASDKELSDAEWTRRRNAQLAARQKRS